MRPHVAWFVIGPLALIGSVGGHAFADVLIGSPTGQMGELFTASGSTALLAPVFMSLAALSLLLALCLRVAGACGSDRRRISAVPFAFLAPMVFVVQEHLESLVHTGSFPFDAVLEPTFLPGLALQLPFALAAYLVALALWRVADDVRRLIVRAAVVPVPTTSAARILIATVGLWLRSTPGMTHPGRGPPGTTVCPG